MSKDLSWTEHLEALTSSIDDFLSEYAIGNVWAPEALKDELGRDAQRLATKIELTMDTYNTDAKDENAEHRIGVFEALGRRI